MRHAVFQISEHTRHYRTILDQTRPLSYGSLQEAMADTRHDGVPNVRVSLSKFPDRAVKALPETLNKKAWAVLKKGAVRDVLSMDFDAIPLDKAGGMIDKFCSGMGLKPDCFFSQHTGNGLHVHIPMRDALGLEGLQVLGERFYDILYFKAARSMGAPKQSLDPNGLKYWSSLGRAPFSKNVKKDKAATTVVPITHASRTAWTWDEAIHRWTGNRVNLDALVQSRRARRRADEGVQAEGLETPLAGCRLVASCAADPEGTKEPVWFDLLRILAAAPNGRAVAHAVSEGHPSYTKEETDRKLDHAETYASPTCALMQAKHGLCLECPHWRKVVHPTDLLHEDQWTGIKNVKFRKIGAKGEPLQVVDLELLQKYLETTRGESLGVSEDLGSVMTWEGNVWSEKSALQMMRDICAPLVGQLSVETPRTMKSFDLQLRTTLPSKIPLSRLAGREGWIYFSDSILDMTTGDAKPHSPATSSGHCLPIKAAEATDATDEAREAWGEYLDSLVNGDAEGRKRQAVLQEHVGHILGGATPNGSNRALYIYGESNNGKSEFFKIVQGLLLPHQTVGVSLNDFSKQTVNNLHSTNALLALDGDVSMADRSVHVKEDSRLKKVITGETVPIKKLYADERDVVAKAKVVALSNGLPTSIDKTGGFYRRWNIVQFPNWFGDRKEADLAGDLLKKCRPAIYEWALEGYKRLVENGMKQTLSPDHNELLAEAKTGNDPVFAFLHEKTVILQPEENPNWDVRSPSVAVGRLYILFEAWLQQEGLRTFSCSKNKFSRRVKSHLHAARPKWQGKNKAVITKREPDGGAVRHFVGVKLADQH